jgi:hypothetical protein
LLNHVFEYKNKNTCSKSAKRLLPSANTIARCSGLLYVLIGLIAFTLIIDLIFTRLLLRPLGLIIRTKLVNRKFPFKEDLVP